MSSELGGTEEKQAVQFTEQAVATPAPENIAAILGHIKRYLKEKKRDYAIAISGGWGCGKTHFIRNELVKENIPLPEDSKSNYRFVYLSLFGLKYDEAIKALAVKLSYRSRWYVSFFANIARSLRFCAKRTAWCVLAVLLFLVIAVYCWGWWGFSLLGFPVAFFGLPWLFDKLSSWICGRCRKMQCQKGNSEKANSAEWWAKVKKFFYSWFTEGKCPESNTLLENGLIAWLSSLNWKGGEQAVMHAFSLAKDSVIILDDLERSVDPVQHLSLINRLSEHYGIRVIAVYNPSALDNVEEYQRQKEKAFRFTYSFKADTADIVNLVLQMSDVSAAAREFFGRQGEALSRHIAHLNASFPEGINLRVLQMSVELFIRLYECQMKPEVEPGYSAYFDGFRDEETDAQFLHQFKMLFAIACQIHVKSLKPEEPLKSESEQLEILQNLGAPFHNFFFSKNTPKEDRDVAISFVKKFFYGGFDPNRDPSPYWNTYLESYAQSNAMDFSAYYESVFPGISLAGKDAQDAKMFRVLDWGWVTNHDDQEFETEFNELWKAIENDKVTDPQTFFKAASMFHLLSRDGVIAKTEEQINALFARKIALLDLSNSGLDKHWSRQLGGTLRIFNNDRAPQGVRDLLEQVKVRALSEEKNKIQRQVIDCLQNNDQETLIDCMGRLGVSDSGLCIFSEESFSKFLAILHGASNALLYSTQLAFGCRRELMMNDGSRFPEEERPFYPRLLETVRQILQAEEAKSGNDRKPIRIHNLKLVQTEIETICSLLTKAESPQSPVTAAEPAPSAPNQSAE